MGAGSAAGAGAYYWYTAPELSPLLPDQPVSSVPGDYEKVYRDIANLLDTGDAENYDDGSYGPILVRLAWHAAGTYDAKTNTGGSNGATMRFPPESEYPANIGLHIARGLLERIYESHPWISRSDLWSLAGVVAVQELSGGAVLVPWRSGRVDKYDAKDAPPDGRLPDATKDQGHLRAVFGRMGFNDQEIVALSGAHALGRCHVNRSGFEGPWTFSPTVLTNHYYQHLIDDKWQVRAWPGPKQFEDVKSKSIMMLPTDMSLIKDKSFRKWVETYARDEDLWYRDFAKAFGKLLELGVPFPAHAEARVFKPYAASS